LKALALAVNLISLAVKLQALKSFVKPLTTEGKRRRASKNSDCQLDQLNHVHTRATRNDGSSITSQLQVPEIQEVRRQLEFEALAPVGSAFAQQSLKSWMRDQYGCHLGLDTSNPQSRARISRARLAIANPAPKP
jgi:hypothetical protein